MAMAWIWAAMVVLSILFGAATGRAPEVGTAALEGASAAVTLCLSIGGMICLWSGVMEVMRRCGLAAGLSRLLRPLLRRLYPDASRDKETLETLAQNMSANLLGLGSAATPAGLRAVKGMRRLQGGDSATNEMCRLVVLNTASIQLLPATIGAVRAAAGAENAFDILPAVWLSSAISVAVGLLAARLLERRRQ